MKNKSTIEFEIFSTGDGILKEAVMLFLHSKGCDFSLFEEQYRKATMNHPTYSMREELIDGEIKRVKVNTVKEPFENLLSNGYSSWIFNRILDFEPYAKDYFLKKLNSGYHEDFMHYFEWDGFYSEYRKRQL